MNMTVKTPPKPKNDMASLAVLVQQPDKFAEIVNAVAHYEQLLGANGNVESAKAFREEAKADRAAAAQELADAREEAARLLQTAQSQAADVRNEAAKVREEARGIAKATAKQAKDWEAKRTEQQAQIDRVTETTELGMQKLEAARDQHADKVRKWNDKIRAVRELFNGND